MAKVAGSLFLMAVVLLGCFDRQNDEAGFTPCLQASFANSEKFSFAVAGHAYGSHHGNNLGLYPGFVTAFSRYIHQTGRVDFLIFAGDMVRTPSQQSWNVLDAQLKMLDLPVFLVLGNHDNNQIGRQYLQKKFGATYYCFDIGANRFLFLDTQLAPKKIEGKQLQFLKTRIEEAVAQKNFFLFVHELLWNAHPRYKGIASNGRSRHHRIQETNFWKDVYPIFEAHPGKNFYLIAGDTGGKKDAVAAFYDRMNNVTFIASGMGEVPDENFLVVEVKNNQVSFRLVPLQMGMALPPLEAYNVQALSGFARFPAQRAP